MKIDLPSVITRNFWLKFFSIALATVIWLAIHYGLHHELSIPISQLNISNLLAQEYIKVPVTPVLPPGDTRQFKINPPTVVVIAVGEKSALRRAAQKGIRAYVDLGSLAPGQGAIAEVHSEAPPDITVMEVNPPTVSVEQLRRP